MLHHEQRQWVIGKLTSACNELEDAMRLSARGARYDPEIIPEGRRNELRAMVDDLKRIMLQIEGTQ